MTEQHFQVHLGGIIDLLSNHLYSSPNVYIRELLQNATDAIAARAHHDSDAPPGTVTIAVSTDGDQRVLKMTDNGIGLTRDETHEFLSTIGASSKRADIEGERSSYIGQFGIGLLSCFVVSANIEVVTRSAKGGAPVKWCGQADGTYEVHTLNGDLPFGTTVTLIAKADMVEWFDESRVAELAGYFGALLPFPIEVRGDDTLVQVNQDPPWRCTYDSDELAHQARVKFGEQLLGRGNFLDVVPLRCAAGEVEGLAFVLPTSPPPTAPPVHRVYLKGMLLSERVDNLLPRWAFFVACVLDTGSLRPTASREGFYEDDSLHAARDALGNTLRSYLIALRDHDPTRLSLIISRHYRAIKALASQDSTFLALFLDALPFDTSLGRMTFAEIREAFPVVRYTATVDGFRELSQVAAAQGAGVINGGYSYDLELIERAIALFPKLRFERVTSDNFVSALAVVEDTARFRELVKMAEASLEDFGCRVALRAFEPAELPALYVTSENSRFKREVEASQRVQQEGNIWSSMLSALSESRSSEEPTLVLNAKNPVVLRLAGADGSVASLATRLLYVQALLLGHHPLRPEETTLLSTGILDLLQWGLEREHTPSLQ